jgi:predicted nucleic acid-binding protein
VSAGRLAEAHARQNAARVPSGGWRTPRSACAESLASARNWPGSAQQGILDGSAAAETVDFARVEVAGVLRKKAFLAGRLSLGEFTAAVRVIDDIGVTVHATTADRLGRAAELAARKMLGMYDALFVQLAQELKLPLLTSDAKLGRAVAGTIQVEVLQGIGS